MLIGFSCSDHLDIENKNKYIEISDDRTVVLYINADNNLDGNSRHNTKSILKGMVGIGQRVVVYVDSRYSEPCLMTVVVRQDTCIYDTVMRYDELNSSAPSTITKVLTDVKDLFPAESYGLFLWSHATAWLPEYGDYSFVSSGRSVNYSRSILNNDVNVDDYWVPIHWSDDNELPLTKTFGLDEHLGENTDTYGNSKETNIVDLAKALPYEFEFIVIDACLMSSVEVLYELKDKASYIIASPVEILASGMPYSKIMSYLWSDENDLMKICDEFYKLYNSETSNAHEHSGVISLIKTAGLSNLANATKLVIADAEYKDLGVSDIRRYPMANFASNVFYDLRNLVENFADSEKLNYFNACLDDVVLYKRSTKYYWEKEYDASKYSGISTYIPLERWKSQNSYYSNFKWAQDVYGF